VASRIKHTSPEELTTTESKQFKLIGYTILDSGAPVQGFRGTNIHVYQTPGIAKRYAKDREVRPVYVLK